MKEFLEYIKGRLTDRNNNSLEMSMNHVHAEGIFSLVIDGHEPGKLTRVFIADKKLKPFTVQFHTHRYPIDLTVIKGDITHHQAHVVEAIGSKISQFTYKSFLNGGNGLSFDEDVRIMCADYKMPIGSSIHLNTADFHTMSCSKGSIWVVQEQGFEVEESKVLGVPFTVDGLYHTPGMFQINDKCQQVLKEVKKILEAYNLVNN